MEDTLSLIGGKLWVPLNNALNHNKWVIQAKYAPIILFLLALLVMGTSLLSEQGIREIRSLERSLVIQREKNADISHKVMKLRDELRSVMSSDRGLERASREELGLVRPNEKIFVFE